MLLCLPIHLVVLLSLPMALLPQVVLLSLLIQLVCATGGGPLLPSLPIHLVCQLRAVLLSLPMALLPLVVLLSLQPESGWRRPSTRNAWQQDLVIWRKQE